MEFEKLMQMRRSVRAYQAEYQVTDEELNALISAVQLAPTWKNSQTGRYYIVRTSEVLEAVRTQSLPAFNQKSSAQATAMIVSTFVKNCAGFNAGEPANEPGNEWGAYDLGLQNAYLLLKASDLGLDTLIMGLRDADVLRKLLEIPEDEEIMAVIAVGKREGEPVFRPRKTNDEIAKWY